MVLLGMKKRGFGEVRFTQTHTHTHRPTHTTRPRVTDERYNLSATFQRPTAMGLEITGQAYYLRKGFAATVLSVDTCVC